MEPSDALAHLFEELRGLVHGTVEGLDAGQLVWRPDPRANSIGWLVWHLTRVQDDHVSEIAGREQVWADDGWAGQFGLAAGSMETGYGHHPERVSAVAPPGPEVLVEYHDLVTDRTTEYLAGITANDVDRIIDRSFDPPVTVGVRLLSVVGDTFQHVGQAAYVRGLLERRS